jgi:16S rRNA G1207 methylase RsmC
MAQEHYFAAQPSVAPQWHDIDVELAGRERTVTTARGIFSSDALDRATRVLLDRVPDPAGCREALDLGCGWGPIALSLALRAPDARVWAVDVNERALEATARNARRLALPGVHAVAPDAVPAGLRFDVIWANPPIRIGKPALHALLLDWLPRLADDGEAWLVVAKQLGADSLTRWLAERLAPEITVERVDTAHGFRVLHAHRHARR